ncbi:MAG: DUF1501 domain-containing protein [Cyanobacteria bacterium]|nr:DUF1501 domain-containing protein [Cyanobacteriota bacterium]
MFDSPLPLFEPNFSLSRRDFLKLGGVFTLSLLASGLPGWAGKTTAPLKSNQKLIVVFLRGAADALSLVVPYGDPLYYSSRPNISIPRPGQTGGCLDLNGYFGLNPNLSALYPYWQKQQLRLILNSGSPDNTRSHFDAQDYMESGTPGVKSTESGWLNRLLQVLPETHSPTRAMNIGPTVPRILKGPVAVANLDVQSQNPNRRMPLDQPRLANAFESLYGAGANASPNQRALSNAFEEGMAARHSIEKSLSMENTLNGGLNGGLNEGSEAEKTAANRGATPTGKFGQFGKKISQLLRNDPSIQVVFLPLGGWDTHVNQGSVQGAFAQQASALGNGLSDLMQGLSSSSDPTLAERTTIVVMSEFGRTVKENGNRGTDHGHGNVMMVMSGQQNSRQLLGNWTGLESSLLFEGRDLPVNTDFRQVFDGILSHRFGLTSEQLRTVFPSRGL